jgi:hypothetical protein
MRVGTSGIAIEEQVARYSYSTIRTTFGEQITVSDINKFIKKFIFKFQAN